MKRNQDNKSEKGQSLVELAGALVVLLILLSGIFDLGRAIFTLFSMQDAAEEGIVYGTSFPKNCTEIGRRVTSNLANPVLLPGDITVVITINGSTCPITAKAGDKMLITVTRDFQITMPFLGGFIGNEIPLKATANGWILRAQP